MKILRKIATILILLSLMSCGGGGGGGGGDSGPPPFRVSLDKSSVSFTISEGQSGAATSILATATGTYTGTDLYVGAVVEGVGIDQNVDFAGVYDGLQITIHVAGDLAVGTYTGRVLFYACSDYNCNHPVGGTPIPVSYTVVVQPSISIAPNPVSMSAVSGSTATADLAVTLPPGATSFSVSSLDPAGWLHQGTVSATTLQLVTTSMRSGTYSQSIQVTANTGQTKSVPVTYTVTPPPGGEHDLTASPSGLSFSGAAGYVTPAQNITVTRPTWDPAAGVSITKTYGSGYGYSGNGWLTVTPTAGGATVEASAVGLAAGTYTATLQVSAANTSTVVSIPVTLTVGSGLISPASNVISIDAATIASGLQGSAQVNVGGTVPPFTWTATSNASWLVLTRSTGLTGTNVDYQIDQTALQGMTNYADTTATITISTAAYGLSSVQFNVTARKQIPEVHYVGPYVLVNGRAATVYVRGRGFSTLSNVVTSLQTPGLTANSVTRINDSEITMQVSPASVADHVISISNALGTSTSSTVLHVIAPQTYAYAAIPSGGIKRTIVFDPQRQSVYTVNVGTEAITRFRYVSGSWNIDAMPLTGILDAGMGPDGSSLVVTSTPGTVRLIDPVTLATQFTLAVPSGLARNLTYISQGISTSNNGRSWLATGDGNWNELGFFDHQTRTMQTRPSQPTLSTTFYSGPWTSIARNGERMLVVQTASVSPQPPLLYSDAVDSLLKINPASLTFSYDVKTSDDGTRALFDQYEVRDENFNLIGRTPIPASDSSYFGVAGAISPNGTRTYILAYRGDALGTLPTTIKPRVYVFDSSTFSATSADLPLIGSFDLADYPTCRISDYNCNLRARTAISPDGNTLFFAGDANLLVVPISASFRTLNAVNSSSKTAGSSTARKTSSRSAPIRPWAFKP